MKNLLIIGCGGFAREVYWHAQESIGYGVDWRIKGFLDGDVKLSKADYELLPERVLGDVDSYNICTDDVFTCAVGTPKIRKRLVDKILSRGGEFINIISELSKIHPRAQLGRGVILSPYVCVSDRVFIGDFVAINARVTIGHDAILENFSCIMPHASIAGKCKIGTEVFIGSGAIILPSVKIDERATVGAGAVVLKKIKAERTVFGNPALEI